MYLDDFLQERAPEDVGNATRSIASACLDVWEKIPFNSGLLPAINPSGEKQTAIDVYSNDAFVKALLASGSVGEVASEEMEKKATGRGALSVAMDPLDGSSNVDTNNPVGSIFGFYSNALPCSGRNLIGAAFVTYGTMVTLTASFGKGVARFVAVREKSDYAFELMDENVMIPDRAEVYGFGGLRKEWTVGVREFVESLEERGMKLRYCGTFVGDYNQVMKKGGIFAYPSLEKRPEGKLRILYETAPVAYITEQAGGYSSDGKGNLLDLAPKSLAETSPAYLGSPSVVKELESALSRS